MQEYLKRKKKMNCDELEEIEESAENIQWTKIQNVFYTSHMTVDSLPPGYYRVLTPNGDIRFVKEDVSTENVVETSSLNAKSIIWDFRKFWQSREIFSLYKVDYKRGVLLSGPPGSGKTCIIKLLSKYIINEVKGYVLDMTDSPLDLDDAIREVRSVHRNTPILVVLEDIDIYYRRVKRSLLNIMDGVQKVDGVVFIATTNHPEQLEEVLINRPGRFDAHYRILPPTRQARIDFIRSFLRDDLERYPISKWADDTSNLPLGHLKELLISIVLFGHNYDDSIKKVRNMATGIVEEQDG